MPLPILALVGLSMCRLRRGVGTLVPGCAVDQPLLCSRNCILMWYVAEVADGDHHVTAVGVLALDDLAARREVDLEAAGTRNEHAVAASVNDSTLLSLIAKSPQCWNVGAIVGEHRRSVAARVAVDVDRNNRLLGGELRAATNAVDAEGVEQLVERRVVPRLPRDLRLPSNEVASDEVVDGPAVHQQALSITGKLGTAVWVR